MSSKKDASPASRQDSLLVRAVVLFLLAGIITFGLAVGTSVWNERQPESDPVVIGR